MPQVFPKVLAFSHPVTNVSFFYLVTAKIDVRIRNPLPRDLYGDLVLVPNQNGTLDQVDAEEENRKPFPHFPIGTAVRFELYTLDNPAVPQLLTHKNETTLLTSRFDPKRPTRIMIHGWFSKGWLTPRFCDAYFLKRESNVNFIAVNWRDGSDTINYSGARRRVSVVGPYVGQFINFLVEVGKMDPKDLVVIGHSLGAHVAGLGEKSKLVVCKRIFKFRSLSQPVKTSAQGG